MKQVFFFVAAGFIFFFSCKYEEGPGISFRSRMSRIIGYKKITSYTVDGKDSIAFIDSLFGGCSGQYYYFIEPKSSSIGDTGLITVFCPIRTSSAAGLWVLEDPKKEKLFIRITYPVMQPGGSPAFPFNSSWTVSRLKEKEVWLKIEENGKKYELRFEAVPKP